MIPEYILSIDPEHAENGEELGIFEIANTATPAIKLKGVAFSSHQTKNIFFADSTKYRIAAPVLTPSKIYRKDPETEEEYNAVVTTEYIETVFVDFMAKRMGGKVFNEEHNEDIKPPSYILETWLVEDPETDKSKTVYGLDVPKGTWFAVQQFTDKDVYKDYVDRGLTGFSIHGHSAMLEMTEIKNDQNKIQMKKENTEMMDALEEGAKFMIGEKYYEVKDGVPVEVVEEDVEMNEDSEEKTEDVEAEESTDKKEDTELAEDSEEKKEETEMNEDTELNEDEKKEDTEMAEEINPEMYYSKEEVDAKFSEVFDMIAELKKGEEVEETAEEAASVQMSDQVDSRISTMASKLEKFGNFSPKNK